MKKICFVTYDNIRVVGGVSTVVLNLCSNLKDEYDISIISICDSPSDAVKKIKNFRLIDLHKNSNERLSKNAIKSWFEMRKILKNEKFDLIFMEGHYTPAVLLLASMFLNEKIVFCDHGALFNQIKDKKITFLRRIASKFSLKVVVLTQRNLNDYRKFFKTNLNKLICIPNFCNKIFYENSGEYNPDLKKILSVGRLSSEKGFDLAVEVANKILHKDDWEWHVYGDGPERENIEKKIREYGLQDRLILKGNINNLHEIYKNYSIFVMTSYREGLPLSIIEAFANNLPCVSFDCVTGPNEIISDDENGFLISCYDVDEMAKKIKSLMENKELRIKFSNNSHINLKKFDELNIMKQWKRLIEELT